MPDMRLPIGYAMGWPDRLGTAFGAIDWSARWPLSFEPPDRAVFPCLDLAYRAGRAGGAAPGLAERRQRGGGGRLPRRSARLAGHRRGGRGHPRPPAPTARWTRSGDVLEADRAGPGAGRGRGRTSAGRRREHGPAIRRPSAPADGPVPDRAGPDGAGRRTPPPPTRRPVDRPGGWCALVGWRVAAIVAVFLLLGLGAAADRHRRHDRDGDGPRAGPLRRGQVEPG